MGVLVKQAMSRGVAQTDQLPLNRLGNGQRSGLNTSCSISSHVNIKYVIHFSIHGLHAHALSSTNGVGQASNSPSHFSRSNDNSRVVPLVCDERLLAFLDYLEGHAWCVGAHSRPRKKEIHERWSWGADESRRESALAEPGDKYVVSRSQPVFAGWLHETRRWGKCRTVYFIKTTDTVHYA